MKNSGIDCRGVTCYAFCHLKAARGTPNLSKSESKWVKEQTSLTGGKVDIDVEDKTTLKGAVIASTHSTGSGQAGDLTLETGSLEYSNIKDKDKSYSVGGGMDVGTKSDKSYGNYEFSDKKQTNFATIGEGTIIVKDSETDLTDLKRDITLAQYNTKEGDLKGE
jgi:filamentous hemagglutinin